MLPSYLMPLFNLPNSYHTVTLTPLTRFHPTNIAILAISLRLISMRHSLLYAQTVSPW